MLNITIKIIEINKIPNFLIISMENMCPILMYIDAFNLLRENMILLIFALYIIFLYHSIICIDI